MTERRILINRAPVLTLWVAVVAERLGHDRLAALSIGKAVAGLNAQAKGRALGIYKRSPEKAAATAAAHPAGEDYWIEICNCPVPVKETPQGVRAVSGAEIIEPAATEAYLASKFGDDLEAVRSAMTALAASLEPPALAASA